MGIIKASRNKNDSVKSLAIKECCTPKFDQTSLGLKTSFPETDHLPSTVLYKDKYERRRHHGRHQRYFGVNEQIHGRENTD